MLVSPKISIETLLGEDICSVKKGTGYVIKFGSFNNPTFLLKNCRVKYAMGKFDKISVEHEYSFISDLNNVIKSSLEQCPKEYVDIKEGELGFKVSQKSRDNALLFARYDVVDVILMFNNCWIMGDKIYPSFILNDIRKSEGEYMGEKCVFTFENLDD